MPTNINEFKLFTEFVSNKVQVGGTVSPSQFNELAHRAQLAVFEKDRKIFLMTENASDYLQFFLKNITLTVPLTGNLTYPSDFQHTASVRSYYVRPDGNSVEIPVAEVKNPNWGEIYISQLQKPSLRFPKYSEFNDHFKLLPVTIGTVMIDYFKMPIAPVWGYTTVSGRPVYDPSSSTDFEWGAFAFNNVASYYLQLIGVNLKDVELSSFAGLYSKETNSPL